MGTLYGDWYDEYKDLFEDKTLREVLAEKIEENCPSLSSEEILGDISEESGSAIEDARKWLCWSFFLYCYNS